MVDARRDFEQALKLNPRLRCALRPVEALREARSTAAPERLAHLDSRSEMRLLARMGRVGDPLVVGLFADRIGGRLRESS